LYSASNRQVSSSYVESFGSYRVDKHPNKQTPLKTSTSLRYATPVGNEWVFYDEVLGTISTTAFVSVTRNSFSADYNSKEKLIATAAYAKLLSAVVFHATGRFTASLAKKLTI